MKKLLKIGIDIGYTTLKVVVLNEHKEIFFHVYRRHFANILATLRAILSETFEAVGEADVTIELGGEGAKIDPTTRSKRINLVIMPRKLI